MEPYKNVLQLILFQKEFYFNYLKKRQSILMLISLAIKRRKKILILHWIIRKLLNKKKQEKKYQILPKILQEHCVVGLVKTQDDDKRFLRNILQKQRYIQVYFIGNSSYIENSILQRNLLVTKCVQRSVCITYLQSLTK